MKAFLPRVVSPWKNSQAPQNKGDFIMKRVCIIGGSGHAKVVADILECMIREGGSIEIVGFVDDDLAKTNLLGYPSLGCLNQIVPLSSDGICFCMGIGDNGIRKKIDGKYQVEWFTAIHPSSIISSHAHIGEGSVIMPNTVVNAGTVIARHTIANSGAIIEHDCKIGNFVHIAPNATLCGNVQVGEGTHIGAGATVIQNIKIGSNSVIGAGAVVVRNICDSVTVKGVPAK